MSPKWLSTLDEHEVLRDLLSPAGTATKPGKENSGAVEGDSCGKVCSVIEGAQLVTPRGKHDLVFYKTLMKVKGKQTIDVPYTSIQNIAVESSHAPLRFGFPNERFISNVHLISKKCLQIAFSMVM